MHTTPEVIITESTVITVEQAGRGAMPVTETEEINTAEREGGEREES